MHLDVPTIHAKAAAARSLFTVAGMHDTCLVSSSESSESDVWRGNIHHFVLPNSRNAIFAVSNSFPERLRHFDTLCDSTGEYLHSGLEADENQGLSIVIIGTDNEK
jgi:hypothetical protein